MGRRGAAVSCEGRPVMADPGCRWVTNGMRTATAEKSARSERGERLSFLVRRKALRAAEGICRERKKPVGNGRRGKLTRAAGSGLPRAGSQDRGERVDLLPLAATLAFAVPQALQRRAVVALDADACDRRAFGKAVAAAALATGQGQAKAEEQGGVRVSWHCGSNGLAKAAHAINRPANRGPDGQSMTGMRVASQTRRCPRKAIASRGKARRRPAATCPGRGSAPLLPGRRRDPPAAFRRAPATCARACSNTACAAGLRRTSTARPSSGIRQAADPAAPHQPFDGPAQRSAVGL